MIYRLSLSTYVNTLLLNKALVLSNRPGPTDTQTPLTYMYRYSQEFAWNQWSILWFNCITRVFVWFTCYEIFWTFITENKVASVLLVVLPLVLAVYRGEVIYWVKGSVHVLFWNLHFSREGGENGVCPSAAGKKEDRCKPKTSPITSRLTRISSM